MEKKMEKKYVFEISSEVLKLGSIHIDQARQLATKLAQGEEKDFLMELDFVPKEKLYPIRYGNGLKSAEIISDLVNSGDGNLKNKMKLSQDYIFKANYELGIKIGLWRRIDILNYEDLLDFNEPFCLKNSKGLTKIWHPNRKIFGTTGFVTKLAIIQFIAQEVAVYSQPFYVPPIATINGIVNERMIFRLVFFFTPQETPEFIGGLWISCPGFKIYPNKDATIGIIK